MLSTSPLKLPFVGRDDSRRTVRDFVRGIGRGEGGALFLTGPAGIGKTRLLEVSLDGVGTEDLTVARARAFPLEEGVPYGIISEALAPVLRDAGPDRLIALTRGWSSELATLLPGVIPAGDVPPAEPETSPAEVRHRLRWILRDLLIQLAASRPLVIVLEDLHWADHPSLELLHFLGRHLAGPQLGLIGTLRTGERGEVAREAEAVRRSLDGLGVGSTIELAPLTPSELETLVAETLHIPGPARASFAHRLHEWSRGNPLFIQEMLRGFVRDGRLRREGDVWVGWEDIRLELSPDLVRTLEGPFDDLSEAGQDLADVAAACGQRQEIWLLKAAAGPDGHAFSETLDELLEAGILIEPGTRGGGSEEALEFVHPLFLKARYEGIGPARREELHRRLAAALAPRVGENPSWITALATHVSRSGSGDDSPAGVEPLLLAGERALGLQANREGGRFFRVALDRAGTPEFQGRARLGLGRASLRIGDFEEAVTHFQWLLEAARETSDGTAAAAALRRLGQVEYRKGSRVEALEWFRLGLEEPGGGEDPVTTGGLHLAVGMCRQELGQPAEAEEALTRALEFAELAGHAVLQSRAHRGLLLVNTWLGNPEIAREHGVSAEVQARAAGLDDLLWSVHWARAVLAGMSGDGGSFSDELGNLRDLDVGARSPLRRLHQWELEVHFAWANGSWADGLTLGEAGIAIARELELGSILIRLLVWTSAIHLAQGRLDRAREYLAEATATLGAREATGRSDVHSRVAVMTGRAGLALEEGRFGEAVDLGTEGLAMARKVGYVAWGIQRLLPIVTEAQLRMGRLEQAGAHGTNLRETASRMGHRLGLAWADASDAIGAWLGGDPAGAIDGLRGAAEALEAIPMIPDAVRLRRQLAGRLAETGDREGALEELRGVHDTLVALGAEPELERTRHMFKELDTRPPAASQSEGAGGLTGRELEVAALAAAGKSNKGIGKALGISPRTASTHLSRVFAKLEIASRSELHQALQNEGVALPIQ